MQRARAAAERRGEAALQRGVRALQRVHRKGDGVILCLQAGERLALLRKLRLKRFALADGAAAAESVVELALQRAPVLGQCR